MTIEEILSKLRPNIKKLKPYSSARHEFQDSAEVYLDANESPYNTTYNRYPDPNQTELKDRIAKISNCEIEQILIGNGSDEVLDLLIRAFCRPSKDAIISFPPTYGMYQVIADINEVENIEVALNPFFQINLDDLRNSIKEHCKIIFVCSPNNPTGNHIDFQDIEYLLSLDILVVVDEAYIDFSSKKSLVYELSNYPNLIICQTLSKAKGLAGLRLGYCIAHPAIIRVLNAMKPPYNVSQANINGGIQGLQDMESVYEEIQEIKDQRTWLHDQLGKLDMVIKIYPSEANFLLVKVKNPVSIMKYTRSNGIVIRDRSKAKGCKDCVRISVGTPEENKKLVHCLTNYHS